MMAKKEATTFKNVAVLARGPEKEATNLASEVVAALKEHKLQASAGQFRDKAFLKQLEAGDFDLVVALGGDGTVLRAGHLCASLDIPLLAINQGHFGFLIELEPDEWRATLPRLTSGDFWFEKRMLIKVELLREGKVQGSWNAINEALVGRGRQARPVHLAASLDGIPLTTYVADGLIIATATGSTAYSLAAGGPVLPPQLRNMVLVPVAAHLSLDRAIVLDEGATIRVELQRGDEAVVSVDGQQSIELKMGDWVDLSASKNTLRFVRFQEPSYFYRRLLSIMDNNPATAKGES